MVCVSRVTISQLKAKHLYTHSYANFTKTMVTSDCLKIKDPLAIIF